MEFEHKARVADITEHVLSHLVSLNFLLSLSIDGGICCRQALMRQCFHEFDVNGDGTISCQELDNVFKSLGKKFTKEELDRMISLADKDKSGTLDYEEFVKKVFG